MAHIEYTNCCGVDEIDGVSNDRFAKETVMDICGEKYPEDKEYDEPQNQAFLYFTDTVESGKGAELAKFITENKLGIITKPPRARRNPNSGNMIMIWIWSPNEKNLKKFYKENSL